MSDDIRSLLNRMVATDIRASRLKVSDAILQQLTLLEAHERDLTALVGRLCREIRRTNPDSALAFEATSYLIREKLTSPLRENRE